jgi:hypothetical protein
MNMGWIKFCGDSGDLMRNMILRCQHIPVIRILSKSATSVMSITTKEDGGPDLGFDALARAAARSASKK